MSEAKLLTCPVRGSLSVSSLAKDGLTTSEEARRIDFINFLLSRKYPKENIAVETIVIKQLGESGRNKVRCDVIAYSVPVSEIKQLEVQERLKKAVLIAEIKRDSKGKRSGIKNQLEPALRQTPGIKVMGAYWDDKSKLLFTKKLVKKDDDQYIDIEQDNLENLPVFGNKYRAKALTIQDLTKPDDLMGLLFDVANVMRSHGINDEQLRYKETVKLILARYCDERETESKQVPQEQELSLQVLPGQDINFLGRVQKFYKTAAKRYSKAKSLFLPKAESELEERSLREIIKLIQGVYFRKANNEMMHQIFQSFVPAVFKKNLDQYFTPNTLIETMVHMVNIGPLDKIADPAMGTGDFLTGVMEYRSKCGDSDIIQRVFGMDIDSKAYDLAIINMILNKDGQSNLYNEDSIKNHSKWEKEIDVALCNPPFGKKSVEKRIEVLKGYDLGHKWLFNEKTKQWKKTEALQEKQQLGVLFIERSFKLLPDFGRMAIILPEGYLCTESYGYIRTWILENLRIISLIELPRRIFLKSDADLRANILVAQKLPQEELSLLKEYNYPIHTEIVRKVGYKMGKGFSIIPVRDLETGEELRDENNQVIVDTDFSGVKERFDAFVSRYKVFDDVSKQLEIFCDWPGGRYENVASRSNLDLKPRRLTIKAQQNIVEIKKKSYVQLKDIAYISDEFIDIGSRVNRSKDFKLVIGQDIRAVEGIVMPQFPSKGWKIAEEKQNNCYKIRESDIVIGLVRPERRNVGIVLDNSDNVVGSPDGIAILRVKSESELKIPITQEWLFSILRSEVVRLQFWTESGGTSYGKLTSADIEDILIPLADENEIKKTTQNVKRWMNSLKASISHWESIWDEDDRYPILNSPIFGLEPIDFEDFD